ncbi:MAG: helix-turn-helix domain-containing protein [Ferrovum sp.]|nr:helix-turn-helix domain-containing protein [Ferrovum sp.]
MTVESTTKTVGERLREQRIEQGKTLEDIARRLHFSEAQLTHLEQAEYALLPSLLVVRGMIRSYAQLLEIEVGDLIHAFELECPNDTVEIPRLVHQGIERPIVLPSRNPILTHGLRILGFVGIVLIALFWWGMQKFKHSAVDVKVEKPVATAPLPAPPMIPPSLPVSALPSMTPKNVDSSLNERASGVNLNPLPTHEKPRNHEKLRNSPTIVEPSVATPLEQKPVEAPSEVTPVISP